MDNRRVKKLIRNAMTSSMEVKTTAISEPDWNELIVDHLNYSRTKRQRQRKWTRLTAMAAVVIVLTFTSLIILTSVDEIIAGNFNFIEAIRNLGRNVEIDEIQEKIDYPTDIEKSINTYATYEDFLGENPVIDYFKADYLDPGYELYSIELTREAMGNTIYVMYSNNQIRRMYAIRGYFENKEVSQSHVWSFPNSDHKTVVVDDVTVDLYTRSEVNHAMFEINGVEFIIEFYETGNGFIENTVRNLKVYGR
ncbi:MAG: hypothetical protein JW903_08170 [Clostridia bacterium]|nr:hypothetical protein [Clostridia bacterium]